MGTTEEVMSKFVVVAVTTHEIGKEEEGNYSTRIWSERFATRSGADDCVGLLTSYGVKCFIVVDESGTTRVQLGVARAGAR